MKLKKIVVVMAIATLILAMTVATVYATIDVKNEKKDTGISIESKEKKVSSYKIKWDYNGGKIGNKKTKVTTVKKGSKIGKLAATPKRSGYTFQGWYTKKSGGKKVSRNTKPSKSVTYFAQWQKKSRALNSEEKKLVGTWRHRNGYHLWIFNKDGTYTLYSENTFGFSLNRNLFQGYYSLKNGVLTTQSRGKYSNIKDQSFDVIPWNNWNKGSPNDWSTKKDNVKFSTKDGKQHAEFGGWGIHVKEENFNANEFLKKLIG